MSQSKRHRTPHIRMLPEEYVATPEQLQAVLPILAAQPILGLDTEFIGENTFRPELCLVQVSTEDALYLLDPMTCGDLRPFWELLASGERETVVHAGREELRMCEMGCGKPIARIFDTQIAAGFVGYLYPAGHAALVNQILKIALAKGETLTNWRVRPLTPKQIRYAYDDVRYLLGLHKVLDRELKKLKRRAWAEEEFAGLVNRSALEPVQVERWRRLRGAGGLNARELAIVRELFAWREAEAARTNRPVRIVLRDDLICEIAKRNPKTVDDLSLIRGLSKRALGEMLQAVEVGRESPVEQWPTPSEREIDPPQVAILTELMSAVLANYCTEMRLATNLAASVSDLRCLVRSVVRGQVDLQPPGASSGWRAATVYALLKEVLNGQRSVKVTDFTQKAPLSYA